MQAERSIARHYIMQLKRLIARLHNATQKVDRTALHDASRKAAPLPVPTQQVSQITKPIDMGWVHAQLHPFLKLISLPPGAYATPYAYFIEGNTCLTC